MLSLKVRVKKTFDEEQFDDTKVKYRHKKATKEEEAKKAKEAEIKEKYAEWGKGLVQKKQREEKLNFDVYEADKPLARYKDDRDLESLLKKQEREGAVTF
jgi:pre-mRNA-splicing factor CWC26